MLTCASIPQMDDAIPDCHQDTAAIRCHTAGNNWQTRESDGELLCPRCSLSSFSASIPHLDGVLLLPLEISQKHPPFTRCSDQKFSVGTDHAVVRTIFLRIKSVQSSTSRRVPDNEVAGLVARD